MFVLCPHCHFLVGIDPRTGKPAAACPKCGGVVVEPLPETHAEDQQADGAHVATPLAPFAPVELPSILPTLPEPEVQPEVPPASATAPLEPVLQQAATPTLATAPELDSAPPPRRSWWSRRNSASSSATSPSPGASRASPAATPPPTAADVAPTEPGEGGRAEALIAAIQVRTRSVRKRPAAQAPRILPSPVVATGTSEAPAAAAPTPAGTAMPDADIAMPATPSVPRSRRQRHAPAPLTATDAAPTTPGVPLTAPPPASAQGVASPPLDIAQADTGVPPHPLRRRTDFDPDAATEPVAGAPPHPLRRRTDAPSFTRPRVRANGASRISWRGLVAVGGLSLLLVLQLLLAQRESLAASPRWRPTIDAVCATLRCSLPPWHEPSAFTMLSRDVRPHPNAPGTLLINASFRNDARWPQPWPRLVLTLSDLDGRMVGARSFAADEYLGATSTQSELAPGQTAAVAMSVVEPAPNIVAFTFDFR